MLKNISNFGIVLNKAEQKSINGGFINACAGYNHALCDSNPRPNTQDPYYNPCNYCVNL